jgi:hypothetical protein
MISPEQQLTDGIVGTLDGLGAGDHDIPFRFGRRPRASAPYPFSTRQYARLLVLRSRFEAGLIGKGDHQPAPARMQAPAAVQHVPA